MSNQVLRSKKDDDGDITGLCGAGWSHNKTMAVANIKRDRTAYTVSVNGRQVYVRVGARNGRDYLTTSADSFTPNNLDSLPDC